MALPLLLGATIGYLILNVWVNQGGDLGRVQRIVEMGRHLETPRPANPWVVFIGNSVTRDGIDGSLVEQAASGEIHAENLALGGFNLNEHRVALPKLLAAKPEAVVFGLSPLISCAYRKFPLDKAYAYAHAGFVDAWPMEMPKASFVDLDSECYAALISSKREQRMHFRTTPLTSFNHHARNRFRSGLRSDFTSDFVHPFEYLGSIGGSLLDTHIDKIREAFLGCERGDAEPSLAALSDLFKDVAESDVMPIAMLLPIHPRLQNLSNPRLDQIAVRLKTNLGGRLGSLVDLRELLNESQFADALHPNAAGRALLSRTIGQKLPPIESQ
jgi:hypothetical protein